MTSVQLDAVRFRYGSSDEAFALHVDHLRLDRGTRAACIGPSGSGKTTLVHLIAGITVPAAGSVRLDDQDIARLDDRARRAFRIAHVGLLFQELELLDYLTAEDNILLPYCVSSLHLDAAVRARAHELAAAAGLGPRLLRRHPDALSQGERQRVAMCRTLITEPSLVLCDEPTGNLDPTTAATVLDLLLDRVQQSGATLLMVTHDHGQLDRFERVIDMTTLHARGHAGIAP